LSDNTIGNTGCEALATLLKDPNSNLQTLNVGMNTINLEGANILANALLNNTKLRDLFLNNNPIDRSGVDIFNKLLCDVSSINSIYSSNHMLEMLGLSQRGGDELDSFLKLNREANKGHVAIKKILKYHPNIDMEPLFEWNMEGEGERNLKALPYVIAWFERAREAVEAVANDEGGERNNIGERKLSAIYQFAKNMPLMFAPVPHDKGGDNQQKRDCRCPCA
jgi:hypothetical protein